MSEELTVVLDEPTVEKPTERDWESEAKGMGWNPEYDGDNKVDAKEFVLRKPLFDDLKKTRKKVRDLEAAVTAQQRLHQEQLEKARERAIAELKAEKRAALESGDVAKVFDVDERLVEASKPVPKVNAGPPPEYSDFVDKNSWYESDITMKRWADSFGYEYKQSHPTASVSEIYEAVAMEAKTAFPEKFENKARSAAPSVEGGGSNPTKQTKEVKLPREHRTIVEAMWKQGAWGNVSFKEAATKYIKDYTERFGDFE